VAVIDTRRSSPHSPRSGCRRPTRLDLGHGRVAPNSIAASMAAAVMNNVPEGASLQRIATCHYDPSLATVRVPRRFRAVPPPPPRPPARHHSTALATTTESAQVVCLVGW